MLFVRVGNYHINMDNIVEFWWSGGKLHIHAISGSSVMHLSDPDCSEYKKLCESIGVRPVEEE